jgi:hypothetical protein
MMMKRREVLDSAVAASGVRRRPPAITSFVR